MDDSRTAIFDPNFLNPYDPKPTNGEYLVHTFIPQQDSHGEWTRYEASHYTDDRNSTHPELVEVFGKEMAAKLRHLRPGQGATWDDEKGQQILVHRIR